MCIVGDKYSFLLFRCDSYGTVVSLNHKCDTLKAVLGYHITFRNMTYWNQTTGMAAAAVAATSAATLFWISRKRTRAFIPTESDDEWHLVHDGSFARYLYHYANVSVLTLLKSPHNNHGELAETFTKACERVLEDYPILRGKLHQFKNAAGLPVF